MNQDDGAASRTFGLEKGEGEARWWLGGPGHRKGHGQGDGRALYARRGARARGRATAPLHHREDEGFWVLEGELAFEVGEEAIKASPDLFSSAPRTSHTVTPWSRVRRSSCSSSRQRGSRSSSTPPASRRRSAPCRPRWKAHPVMMRWSSSGPLLASTAASSSSSRSQPGRGRAHAPSL